MRSTHAFALTILLTSLSCTTAPSDWQLERARERRDDGKPDSALRLTEQALERRYDDPDPAVVDLHVALLQETGRTAEAESFREFVDRYGTGADTYEVDPSLSWKDCRDTQPGLDLIRSWGDPPDLQLPYTLDSLVATFEIDSEGNVGKIKVVRARHPGAAWWIIRSIGTAKLSQGTLEHRRETDPASFPVPLCAWWTFRANASRPTFWIRGSGI